MLRAYSEHVAATDATRCKHAPDMSGAKAVHIAHKRDINTLKIRNIQHEHQRSLGNNLANQRLNIHVVAQ